MSARRACMFSAAALLSAGCESSFPGRPTSFPTTIVEGAILFAGRPLPNGGVGWVTFYPEARTVGDVAVARIDANGGYRCDHVPVGPLNVRIDVAPSVLQSAPMELKRWVQVLRGPASPLRVTSRENEATRFDFDLRPPG